MGKAPSSSMYRWDHQPGAPRVRNPDFLDRPRIQVLVLGRNRQRFLTIKQSLELHGRHEVSAYTFNEDEAVELAQWKPFDVLLVTPEVTAAEAQEGINMVCTTSVNQQIVPVYSPGNDRNAVNAVLEVRLPDRHKLAPPAREAPAMIADEKLEADLAYFTAKSTVDAFEEKRAAQAAKEAEVKAAEEAKKQARAEAAQAKADEARSAQDAKKEERKAKVEDTKQKSEDNAARAARIKAKARFEQQLEAVFERTDKNHDGHLTRAEVIRALKGDIELPQLLHMPEKVDCCLARANTQNEFEEAFQHMDSDGNREINLAEFKLHCVEIRAEQLAAMSPMSPGRGWNIGS